MMSYALPLLIVLSFGAPGEDPFVSQVRPTEPLAPREQLERFKVPPGFEIQLFAAEPDLQKPMNMAFDAGGRLWVSGSVEYPYAAAEGEGRDAIRLLRDTDGDGTADHVTTFVDGLNIPMGLYPYRDGVIAYSIPHIWFFRDTDGDGRADRREILFKDLGQPRDTHGMQNAFRRGFDGWLYINHGFSNESTIRGSDGSSVKLESGNTYRVRLDGSRVEQFTWGQVNPFGSTFLPDGDLITADCHSRPLTLLLAGAYYPSFGKPHDGLGFGPDLMEHSHGSTAISGAAFSTGSNFPPEYQGHLFVGNVMTSRVNHDVLKYSGSTPRAIESPDFVSCDDPWFRPVDLQFGPDGALYVADFYNRIIGHYEVPLDHPGRDRVRGRIWRIVYRGDKGRSGAIRSPDLATAETTQLVESLADSSLTVRMLAMDQLSDRVGEAAVPALIEALGHSSETIRLHSMWSLYRLGKLTDDHVRNAIHDASELVRIHGYRAAGESGLVQVDLAEAFERESSPRVRRAAALAVSRQRDHDVRILLQAAAKVSPDDALLAYAMRITIRNQLRSPAAWKVVNLSELTNHVRDDLARLAVAVPSSEAAQYLFTYLRDSRQSQGDLVAQLNHLAMHLPVEQMEEAIETVRMKSEADVDLQLALLRMLQQRASERRVPESMALRNWAMTIAESLLRSPDNSKQSWKNQSADNPWGLEPRQSEDGQDGTLFLSSLPGGEAKTGTIVSRKFAIPPKLTFYLCGHLGLPNQPALEENFVQIRLVESGQILHKTLPPRNDTARRVAWDLAKYAGQQGQIEIVDGIDLAAFAWLAVARFDPPVVTVPAVTPAKRSEQTASACELVAAFDLADFRPDVLSLLKDSASEWTVRAAAARALIAHGKQPLSAALAEMIAERTVDIRFRAAVCEYLSEKRQEEDGLKLLSEIMKTVPARTQRQLSDSLASSSRGAEVLLDFVEHGYTAARLLQDPVIRQKVAAHGEATANRAAAIVAALPPASAQLQRLVEERRRAFRESAADVRAGSDLFKKHCAACHQVAGTGAVVGPQLDGIGNRGAERIIEDVLDPNRNVDVAFHVSILSLANGQVVQGLFRREEGSNLIFANQEGKEFTVAKSDIDEQAKSASSLMPANVGELLKPSEFQDLLGYLLGLRERREGN